MGNGFLLRKHVLGVRMNMGNGGWRDSCVEGWLDMVLSVLCSKVVWREYGWVVREERAAWHAVMSVGLLSLLIIEGLGWCAHFTGKSFHLYEKCRQKCLELSCIWEGWTEGLWKSLDKNKKDWECWGKHDWAEGRTSKGCESCSFGKRHLES